MKNIIIKKQLHEKTHDFTAGGAMRNFSAIDIHYLTANDTYRHGFTFKLYQGDIQVECEKMKSFFIDKVKYFKQTNSYLELGAAFHPLLDSYLPMNPRVAYSINYFSYDMPVSIVDEVNMVPNRSEGFIKNILTLHNMILGLPSNVSEEQLGALFEGWRMSHIDH